MKYYLNDHLDTGPNFIPSLFDTLVKFRCYPIALTADIEKAFLQIEIKPEDRDKLRFLWMDNPFNETDKLLHLRFCRLVFGLKSSPAILGATINHHLEKHKETEPVAVQALQDLYVREEYELTRWFPIPFGGMDLHFYNDPRKNGLNSGIRKKSIRQQRMRSSNNQKRSRVCWLELSVLKSQTWPP